MGAVGDGEQRCGNADVAWVAAAVAAGDDEQDQGEGRKDFRHDALRFL